MTDKNSFVLNLQGSHGDKNCPINRLTETKTYHLTLAQYLCLLIPTAPCLENIGREIFGKFWGKLCNAVMASEPMCTTVDTDIFQMLSIVKCFKYCH